MQVVAAEEAMCLQYEKVVTSKGTVFSANLANKVYQSTNYDRLVAQLREVAAGA